MRKDLIGFIVLAVVSLGFGLGLNAIRSEPLPLVYERPLQRIAGDGGEGGLVVTGNWSPGVNLIDLKTMGGLVEEKSAIILDARSDLFFEFGHIPGAVNLARKNFDADYSRLEKLLAPAKEGKVPVIIYCSGQHCEDSAAVAESLLGKGFPIILVFEGGYKEWEAAGMKTVQGT